MTSKLSENYIDIGCRVQFIFLFIFMHRKKNNISPENQNSYSGKVLVRYRNDNVKIQKHLEGCVLKTRPAERNSDVDIYLTDYTWKC